MLSRGKATLELDDEQATQVWFAVDEAEERYEKSLRTRCDDAPNFGPEDVVFLEVSIKACRAVKAKLLKAGYTP